MGDPAPTEGEQAGALDVRHEFMQHRVAVTLKVKPSQSSAVLASSSPVVASVSEVGEVELTTT